MKNSNIFVGLLLSFLSGITICQVPVIISQPTDVTACEGDSVNLAVITDKVYNFQWYTAIKDYQQGFSNYKKLDGKNAYSLTLDPVLDSLNPENLYYLLQIINHDDTLWSAAIKLTITTLTRPLDDTIRATRLPVHININLPFFPVYSPSADLIWSTGDTTHYPNFNYYPEFQQYGKYWVKSKKYECSRTDTFTIVKCPSAQHVNEDKNSLQCWCADTVYLDKDVNMNAGVTIIPGTTVKFNGNYRLSSRYIQAYGTKNDSIQILGNTDNILHSNQGYLFTWSLGYYEPGNSFNNLVIKNMRGVHLAYINNTGFFDNDSLDLWGVNGCIIGDNKRVEISLSIENSIIYGNDSIIGFPNATRPGSPNFFQCFQNIFRSNMTGLYINSEYGDRSNSDVVNNIFDSNKSTAITINANANNNINENIFKYNSSQTTPSVMRIYSDSKDYSGNSNLNFGNNTLYNNNSRICIGKNFEDTLYSLSGNIVNNAFWDACSEIPFDFGVQNPDFPKILIANNSFRGSKASLPPNNDTNFTVSGNLFETYPDFSDTLHSLLTLKESSPLIDAGNDSLIQIRGLGYTTDFTGFPRKIGNAVDIGAYEYHRIAPLAFGYITPDTLVCKNDSATLKAFPVEEYSDELYKYNWYKNGELISDYFQDRYYFNLFQLTDMGGYYTAALSNSADTIRSNPIFVEYEYKPVIEDQPVLKEVCMGLGVTFHVNTSSRHSPVYKWFSAKNGVLPSTSDTCFIKSAMESDTLYATATNACGSTESGPMLLYVLPLPEPNLGKDTSIYPADSILLNAGPDYLKYTWNTGEQGQQIFAHAGDTASVKVTNWLSCAGSDTIIIINSGLTDVPSADIDLICVFYPNPAKDKLFVRVADDADLPCLIKIVSQEGKLMTEMEIRSTEEQVVNVADFGKGIYFIRIEAASGSGIRKFIVL